jgi:citrate synthase
MTRYIGADEASQLLGVTKPTLYAYVSRGAVTRRTAVDGRTSLYDRDELAALAARSRRRPVHDRPSIDVRIASSITRLDEGRLSYRGRDAVALAATSTFEQVAELLWTGSWPDEPIGWSVDRDALAACRAVVAAAGPVDPVQRLVLAATRLADDSSTEDPAALGRRLLAIAPSILGGPQRGTIAERLARAWSTRATPELVAAISRSLVLLADHELAASTLAVRVAASVRADPSSAVVAGLATVRGTFHGAASREVLGLFTEATGTGAPPAIARRLRMGQRLPGFGHSVYRDGDPRFAPLLDAVRALGSERIEVVDSVVSEAGRVVGVLPNVDLALGALIHVAELPHDVPLFAVARIAGWIAHYAEELDARPVRFRGVTTRLDG